MAKIKLKGNLDSDLIKLGLKEGDIIIAFPDSISTVGAMNFERVYNGFTQNCVVWPQNYELVEEPTNIKPDRTRFYPTQEELEKLGFVEKGEGNDARDFWLEIDLCNDYTKENEITLQYDAYCDFTLYLPGLTESVPLNFQSVNELAIFIQIFKRPYNHAFAGLFDMAKSNNK